ncbi:heme NO-binding domain-containing protein [Alcanivorax sp. DP30]|uniref:heme NO-binding domain-containing protein n=1 Tax=Alcanivorax sp. DP30 TaxID=2606217 RepID=UPI00137068DE|nr:heme NO-binding domain-containing protein [Alcanivorax sp. DP30]MZR63780.1 heme ABC transporter permease CcmB [Alcanivorax sp. DP30]
MHGAIVSSFKRYLDSSLGEEIWQHAVEDAGLKGKTYMPVSIYPDEEMEALLTAAERSSGLRRDNLLEDFGEWVIAPMMHLYRAMIPQDSDAISFLVNLQQTHERILRLKDPEARAPGITVKCCGGGLVEIHYASSRNMAAMIPGAVRGIAAWFHEEVTLLASEPGPEGNATFVFRLSSGELAAKQVV